MHGEGAESIVRNYTARSTASRTLLSKWRNYSRACEYTCDRFGAHYRADGAVKGLLVLAAGKKLYRQVDAHDYSSHAEAERGFWVGFAEILSTHPNLPKRVQAVVERGTTAAQAVPAAAAYALK